MQIDLYQTFKSINVSDDQAKLAVNSLEAYMEKMMSDATKPLQDKLDSTKAELGAKIDSIQWLMRIQAAFVALIGFGMLAISVANAFFKH